MDKKVLCKNVEDKKQHTVFYIIEVTEVINSVDTDFLLNDYPDIVAERIKNTMNADDVHLTSYKVFRHDGAESNRAESDGIFNSDGTFNSNGTSTI